ncbi:MAG: hypothetical protein ABI723_08445 [Bacteroidia bacterium]
MILSGDEYYKQNQYRFDTSKEAGRWEMACTLLDEYRDYVKEEIRKLNPGIRSRELMLKVFEFFYKDDPTYPKENYDDFVNHIRNKYDEDHIVKADYKKVEQ